MKSIILLDKSFTTLSPINYAHMILYRCSYDSIHLHDSKIVMGDYMVVVMDVKASENEIKGVADAIHASGLRAHILRALDRIKWTCSSGAYATNQ